MQRFSPPPCLLHFCLPQPRPLRCLPRQFQLPYQGNSTILHSVLVLARTPVTMYHKLYSTISTFSTWIQHIKLFIYNRLLTFSSFTIGSSKGSGKLCKFGLKSASHAASHGVKPLSPAWALAFIHDDNDAILIEFNCNEGEPWKS